MVEYTVKHKEEIGDFIYDNESYPRYIIDKDKLQYFTWSDVNIIDSYVLDTIEPYMIFAICDNKIVGIVKLGHYHNENINNKRIYSIAYICVHDDYQHCSIAKNLSHKMFSLARVNDIIIKTTTYSKDGWFKMKPLWNKLSEEYNVKFIDTKETVTIFNTIDYNAEEYVYPQFNLLERLNKFKK